MKIRNRLSWLISITAIVIFLLFGWTIYQLDSRFYFEGFYKRLEDRLAMVEVEYQSNPHEFENTDWNDPLDVYYKDKEIAVKYDDKGKELLDNLLEEGWEHIPSGKEPFRFQIEQKQGVGKIILDGGQKVVLLVLAVDKDGEEKLQFLKKSLFIEGGIAIVILVLVMRIEIRRLLMPLESKIQRASKISADRLDLRLQINNPIDEIGQVALAFNKMLDRLEIAFEAQKQFVRNASHEIKNPLTAIKGEIEILLQKERSPEEYKSALSIISKEADRLEVLTKQLLALEKANAIDEISNPILFSVEQIILEVAEKFPPQLIKLSIEGNEGHCQVKGNSKLFQTALLNLVDNALKYSNNLQVEIKCSVSNNKVIVTILDQGLGIPEKDIKNIFQPLFRASNALNKRGHGIGLPLAKRIIELHNGTIGIESTQAVGTKVNVELPCA